MCLAAVPAQHTLPLWVLTHQHLSKTGRIRAFMHHLAGALLERPPA